MNKFKSIRKKNRYLQMINLFLKIKIKNNLYLYKIQNKNIIYYKKN